MATPAKAESDTTLDSPELTARFSEVFELIRAHKELGNVTQEAISSLRHELATQQITKFQVNVSEGTRVLITSAEDCDIVNGPVSFEATQFGVLLESGESHFDNILTDRTYIVQGFDFEVEPAPDTQP